MRLSITGALLLLLWVPSASGATPGKPADAPSNSPATKPEDTVHQCLAALRQALKQNAKGPALAALGSEWFDYEELSRRSLDKAWGEQPKKDQERFAKLQRTLIEANYLPRVEGTSPEFGYRIDGVERQGDEATVHVFAWSKTVKMPLDFRLRVSRVSKERWIIYDMVIDDVDLVETYQEQFTRVLAKSGMPGLFTALETKLASLQKAAEKKLAP